MVSGLFGYVSAPDTELTVTEMSAAPAITSGDRGQADGTSRVLKLRVRPQDGLRRAGRIMSAASRVIARHQLTRTITENYGGVQASQLRGGIFGSAAEASAFDRHGVRDVVNTGG
jgi:hypothetical protein